MITGRGKAEQGLEQTMDMRRFKEIAAARHMRDALDRIVDDDGEMVARADILAGEDDIAPAARVGLDLALLFLVEKKAWTPCDRPCPCRGARRFCRAGPAPRRRGLSPATRPRRSS